MNIDKKQLVKNILSELEQQRRSALSAADQAHESATHKENIAENKYDTLGLEAAYLAHGQSIRVAELEKSIADFKRLPLGLSSNDTFIQTGALIELLQEKSNDSFWYFLAPACGGMSVKAGEVEVTLITPGSPLGRSLLNKYLGDEIQLQQFGKSKVMLVNGVY